MRKSKFLVCIVCVLLIITGCGDKKELTVEDFEEIRAGMSTEEVIDILGEPLEIVSNNNTAHEQWQVDNDNNNDRWLVDDPNYYYKFAGGSEEELRELGIKLEDSKNLIYYHYEYGENVHSGEPNYQNVYIIDDVVVMMSFM